MALAALVCLPLACGGRAIDPALGSGTGGAEGTGASAGGAEAGGTPGSGGASSGAVGGGGGGFGAAGSGGTTSADAGGSGSGAAGGLLEVTATLDYFKSSHPAEDASYGGSVALSADGRTLAISSPLESSAAAGIDGDPNSNSIMSSGAVFVYVRQNDTWVREAYIKTESPAYLAYFGASIALSASGDRLVVGASGEASSTGNVYLFSRTLGSWALEGQLKASNGSGGHHFGTAVAVSADGGTIAVGAPFEQSAATGVGGDQTDDSTPGAGSVYVFSRLDGSWNQQAYLKASNTGEYDNFGTALALSDDGSTLVVGAPYECSAATGLGGDQTDDAYTGAGAAYVFERSGSTWAPPLYLKASNTSPQDHFGHAVACSDDGNTIAIGAHGEGSLGAGINGDQLDSSGSDAGAVYVFSPTEAGTGWVQRAYVKASNPHSDAAFGLALGLSGDGSTLLVGAPLENGTSTGINGSQEPSENFESGAGYLFQDGSAGWQQLAYVKASNTSGGARFGSSVALSANGTTAALGSPYENGVSPGINGDPHAVADDNFSSGAAYVYTFD